MWRLLGKYGLPPQILTQEQHKEVKKRELTKKPIIKCNDPHCLLWQIAEAKLQKRTPKYVDNEGNASQVISEVGTFFMPTKRFKSAEARQY